MNLSDLLSFGSPDSDVPKNKSQEGYFLDEDLSFAGFELDPHSTNSALSEVSLVDDLYTDPSHQTSMELGVDYHGYTDAPMFLLEQDNTLAKQAFIDEPYARDTSGQGGESEPRVLPDGLGDRLWSQQQDVPLVSTDTSLIPNHQGEERPEFPNYYLDGRLAEEEAISKLINGEGVVVRGDGKSLAEAVRESNTPSRFVKKAFSYADFFSAGNSELIRKSKEDLWEIKTGSEGEVLLARKFKDGIIVE